MRRIFLFAAIIFLISSGNISAQTARDIHVQLTLNFEGFIIEPHEQFINEVEFTHKIKKAVLLIKEKAPGEYKVMQSVIGKIRATQISGANYNEEIMTIDIAQGTFDASLEWLASVLIHETQHIKKYKDTGKKYGNAHLMTDKKAAFQVMVAEEMECNRIQLAVLEKIGGAKYEIEHLKAQKGDHFDIDKDGDYDSDDYNARDWE